MADRGGHIRLPGALNDASANDLHSVVDQNGMPARRFIRVLAHL
jgi:hypothetical protein